ncbi:MAG: topoisomerase DNA-binding C4 zinc finger domain-containing protein [Promethearchaeota archaeon]
MWDGKYGLFFGCRGYPSCTYSLNLNKPEMIICPLCGSLMEHRTSTYGEFMGCTSFPQCRFTFKIIKKKKK